MFMKTGNYNEFGVRSNFKEFTGFLESNLGKEMTLDIHNVVQATINLSSFTYYLINDRKYINRWLTLDDYNEKVCTININIKHIRKIFRGVGFYADQYIVILKHNIMYHLYIE